jgi:hypothetical protein
MVFFYSQPINEVIKQQFLNLKFNIKDNILWIKKNSP